MGIRLASQCSSEVGGTNVTILNNLEKDSDPVLPGVSDFQNKEQLNEEDVIEHLSKMEAGDVRV